MKSDRPFLVLDECNSVGSMPPQVADALDRLSQCEYPQITGCLLAHKVSENAPELDGYALISDPLGPRFRTKQEAQEKALSFAERDQTMPWSVMDGAVALYLIVSTPEGDRTKLNPEWESAEYTVLVFQKISPASGD